MRRGGGVDVVDALLPLGREHRGQPLPQCGGALGRPGQEAGVTGVRGVVALDEVADVDRRPATDRGRSRRQASAGVLRRRIEAGRGGLQ